jgi:hypothetical protein
MQKQNKEYKEIHYHYFIRMSELNIVDLIENNPLTKLSNTYQSKLITKIKSNFNDEEQQMFVASFYCYLNYDKNTDFVIDLDNVWKWLGFYQKDNAKHLLEKQFEINTNFKYVAPESTGAKPGRGGHNIKKIYMTIETFKSFCLKACTKKADQIHKYYLKLEETLQEVLNEETNELRIQLQEKDKLLQNSEKDKLLIKERTLIAQFPDNVECIYYGIIDNVSDTNEKLIKFGSSNFLAERIDRHKKTFANFYLLNAFKVDNKVFVENAIKKHDTLSKLRRTINIQNTRYTELLAIAALSIQQIDAIIKDLIINLEYNPDNYKKILKEYDCAKRQNIVLAEENEKLKNENIKLLKKYKINDRCNHVVSTVEYNNITNSLKRIAKNRDGLYHINGKTYKLCAGTRLDVWNEIAYKTTGGLTKSDLLMNKKGIIVSKNKFIHEKLHNKFEDYNNSR